MKMITVSSIFSYSIFMNLVDHLDNFLQAHLTIYTKMHSQRQTPVNRLLSKITVKLGSMEVCRGWGYTKLGWG